MKSALHNRLPSLILGILFALCSTWSMAEKVAVVVNTANTASLDVSDIAKIYLGKIKNYPDGTTVLPLDQTAGTELRVYFLDKAVGKSEAQMKAYWSRLIFTGKGVPPQILKDDDEVKLTVSRNKDAMGFIDAASVDDTVKVIATF